MDVSQLYNFISSSLNLLKIGAWFGYGDCQGNCPAGWDLIGEPDHAYYDANGNYVVCEGGQLLHQPY